MQWRWGAMWVGVLCLVGSGLAYAGDVEFPDEKLDQVIREILKKKQIDKLDKSKKITDEDVGNIYFLEAPNKGIENLVGLEKCRNLALVKLTNNKIKDVKPLEECVNIQSLDLAKNQIADVTPLGKLVKLQYLQLEDNQVQNIEPVASLKSASASGATAVAEALAVTCGLSSSFPNKEPSW